MARGVRLCQIQWKAWAKVAAEETGADIKRSADAMGLRSSGIIRLPTRRTLWSVMRGPFVHKKSMQQYERRTHNRLIEFYGESSVSTDATKMVHFLRYFEHTILEANPGSRAKVTLFSDELLEKNQQIIDEELRQADAAAPGGGGPSPEGSPA